MSERRERVTLDDEPSRYFDITPTMLLSNLLADHLATNKELIQQVAREGLKRSLENTFNDNKD